MNTLQDYYLTLKELISALTLYAVPAFLYYTEIHLW